MGGRKDKRKISFSIKRKYRSSTSLALLTIGLLLIVIVAGKSIQFISSLNQPITEDSLIKKKYTLNNYSSVNVAINYQGTSLLNYDPVNKKIVILKIPDDTYFELPYDLGTWRAGSIYNLGQEEKPPVGAELLRQSLSKLLGLPIDGYISIGKKGPPLNQMILSLHQDPFKIISFTKSLQSDFTPLEMFGLLRSIASVRADKLSYLDLAQSSETYSKLLPDSSRVLGVDSVKLDLFIRERMADQIIVSESFSVGVYNGTNYAGLGNQVAREITNMGGNVIFVSNTENPVKDSAVIYPPKSKTGERLSQIFAPKCLSQKCEVNDFKILTSRAQVTVVLGGDYYHENLKR